MAVRFHLLAEQAVLARDIVRLNCTANCACVGALPSFSVTVWHSELGFGRCALFCRIPVAWFLSGFRASARSAVFPHSFFSQADQVCAVFSPRDRGWSLANPWVNSLILRCDKQLNILLSPLTSLHHTLLTITHTAPRTLAHTSTPTHTQIVDPNSAFTRPRGRASFCIHNSLTLFRTLERVNLFLLEINNNK